jgi:hypothetical protein
VILHLIFLPKYPSTFIKEKKKKKIKTMVFSSVPFYLDPPNWQQVMFSSISIHIAS